MVSTKLISDLEQGETVIYQNKNISSHFLSGIYTGEVGPQDPHSLKIESTDSRVRTKSLFSYVPMSIGMIYRIPLEALLLRYSREAIRPLILPQLSYYYNLNGSREQAEREVMRDWEKVLQYYVTPEEREEMDRSRLQLRAANLQNQVASRAQDANSVSIG